MLYLVINDLTSTFVLQDLFRNQHADIETFEKDTFSVIPTPDKDIRGQAPVGILKDSKTLDSRLRGNDKDCNCLVKFKGLNMHVTSINLDVTHIGCTQ